MAVENSDISLVILAAGASKRLGTPKQLIDFKGKSLIAHTVQISQQSMLGSIIVVTGANHALLENELKDSNETIVFNANWKEGMASSIQEGLKKVREINKGCQAVIFLVCDQPFITALHLQKLASVYREHKASIVASTYDNHMGVPALFDQSMFGELEELSGDMGARKLMLKYADSLEKIPFPPGAIDIDTPADLEYLKK